MLSTALLSSGCSEAFNSRLPCSVCTPLILSNGIVAILVKTLKLKNYVKGILVCLYVERTELSIISKVTKRNLYKQRD